MPTYPPQMNQPHVLHQDKNGDIASNTPPTPDLASRSPKNAFVRDLCMIRTSVRLGLGPKHTMPPPKSFDTFLVEENLADTQFRHLLRILQEALVVRVIAHFIRNV